MNDLVNLNSNLKEALLEAFNQYKNKIAIKTSNEDISYNELYKRSISIADFISTNKYKKVAILGYRSVNVYAVILAAIFANRTYVPLNPRFPVKRTIEMILDSDVDAIIVCKECAAYLKKLLKEAKIDKDIIVEASDKFCEQDFSKERSYNITRLSFTASNKTEIGESSKIDFDENKPIYVIYTSGTTGKAKGVIVSYFHFFSYIEKILNYYNFNENDVFSQMSEITFDLSLQDLCSSILSGGTLISIPKEYLFCPAPIISKFKITVFHAVPYVISMLKKMEMLEPELMNSIRISIFVGEPLWYEQVRDWIKSCPNSIVYNTYGPTETTVIIMRYKVYDPKIMTIDALKELEGVVPLGTTFPRAKAGIFNDYNVELAKNEIGQIYLAGDQVGLGYLNSKEKTNEAFLNLDGTLWYKTGDNGYVDDNGNFIFKGRRDDQVKINGFRVDLLEIDEKLRLASKRRAMSIPLRNELNQITNLVAAVEGDEDNKIKDDIVSTLKNYLPFYMQVHDIVFIKEFPVNYNGKLDRKALTQQVFDCTYGK